ncbi:MAG: endonuclease domain-containing protein [Candidatus Cloacimonetes bacterium]|nr:endonuclease domain-containing protein [Candidatus Cloacimonadota bacterium]
MSNITQVVRELRKEETLSEKKFWTIVRNRQINGMKFRRQYPISFEWDDQIKHFIADFYCHECKLVFEIDGGIHELQKNYDILRTYIINQLGIKVIRFTNKEVLNNMENVLVKLKRFVVPSPDLSQRERNKNEKRF